MKKRILIVSAVFPPEPVTSSILNYDLAKHIANKGYDVTVITPNPTRPSGFPFETYSFIKDEPFKRVVLDSFTHPQSSFIGRMRESISFGKECVKYLQQHRHEFDFVYNDGWQLFGLYLVAKECVKQKIPYIVPIQDIYPESILTKIPNIFGSHWLVKKMLGGYDKYYQKHAHAVRTISNSMADYLSSTRGVCRKKIIPIANWQDDKQFKDYRSPFRKNGHTTFMFVGNNNKQANVELMIRAFAKANLANAELRIMGGGNAKEDCISLVKKLCVANITFGNVPTGLVPTVQKEADVMVLALKKGTGHQGVPSKMTAYMFSGKPIIASVDATCDTANIIRDAQAGIVTKADDIDTLSEAFLQMTQYNAHQLKEMGERSRIYAEKELSRESNLKKICDVIDNIIE